jgi:hypothetical protein
MDYIRLWSSNKLNMGVIGIGYEEEENKWVFISSSNGGSKKEQLLLFGNLSTNPGIITTSTNNILETFSNENDLQVRVDTFVEESGYYQWQAENINTQDDDNYLGISDKYPPKI